MTVANMKITEDGIMVSADDLFDLSSILSKKYYGFLKDFHYLNNIYTNFNDILDNVDSLKIKFYIITDYCDECIGNIYGLMDFIMTAYEYMHEWD